MARVALLVPDLLFGSRLQAALSGAGHEVLIAGAQAAALAAASDADVLVVDLEADGIDAAPLAQAGPATLGFYSHTNVDVRTRALEAGFDLVVPRSRMNREGAELVARLAPGA